jgi:hypothetical protein
MTKDQERAMSGALIEITRLAIELAYDMRIEDRAADAVPVQAVELTGDQCQMLREAALSLEKAGAIFRTLAARPRSS